MALVSLLFVYFVIIIVVVFVSTITAIGLFIAASVMKRRQLSAKKKAEMFGDYNYQIKKTYLVPKVFGFVCMAPLILCIVVVVLAFIDFCIEKNTSLTYNVLHANTEQVEKILDGGAFPDCTEYNSDPASDGEETLLYMLADGVLYDRYEPENESEDYVQKKTLEMMELLIENGADVNYVVYDHIIDNSAHKYQDEYSIYHQTDKCGWTPLMAATYNGDLDMIKLLVENGADVHAVDYCGHNVIDIVADFLDDEEGYEILEYYLDKGVDPNHVTNFNQDALWLAARRQSGSSPLDNDMILKKLEELK